MPEQHQTKTDKKKDESFDVLGAQADIVSDIRKALSEVPTEHQETIRLEILRDLQVTLRNVGAAPNLRTPIVEVPREDGQGVRPVPTSEFLKGSTKSEGIPNASPLAKQIVESDEGKGPKKQ